MGAVLRRQPWPIVGRMDMPAPVAAVPQVANVVPSTQVSSEVKCSMFAGLVEASVSPQCCFSVNVVAHRGLQAYGMDAPCKSTWDCVDGMPTPDFERRAVQAVCSEPACVVSTKRAMQANWMTSRGASKLGGMCAPNVTIGAGSSSRPYPSGDALKALLKSSPCDSDCQIDCRLDKCTDAADEKAFCAKAENKEDKCYDTCCVIATAAEEKSEMACFPGQAQVHTKEGLIDMSELLTGDEVLVETAEGVLAFEPVLTFIHTVPAHKTDGYVALKYEGGVFRASENHLVYLCGANGKEEERFERRAGDVRVGDRLCGLKRETGFLASEVFAVEQRRGARGMFAPLTFSGKVVVDGALASNYALPAASGLIKHSVMHATLLPMRAYYSYGLDKHLAPVWAFACSFLGFETPCSSPKVRELHPFVSLLHQTLHLEKLATLL